MRINFPFYPMIGKEGIQSGWYCYNLQLDFDSNIGRLILESINVSKGQKMEDIPPLTPFASFEAINLNDLRRLCDENHNAIGVRHYLRTTMTTKNIIIIAIIDKSQRQSNYALKLSSQETDALIIGLPENIVDKIRKFNEELKKKSHEKISREIDVVGKSLFLSPKMNMKIVDLEHIRTYPQILTWPFHLLPPINSHVRPVDIIEVLLGSMVIEEKYGEPLYVFPFLPTPLLSAYYHSRKNRDINPLLLPSINIYDVGSLSLELDLQRIAKELFNSVGYSLIMAYKLLKDLNADLHFDITIDDLKTSTTEDKEVDPKALLKALLSSFLFTGLTIAVWEKEGVLSSEQAKAYTSELKMSYIKQRLPHKFSHLRIALDPKSTVFSQLGLFKSRSNHIRVLRSYVDVARPDFIETLLNKLYDLKVVNSEYSKKYSMTQQLLAAYLLVINDFIGEFRKAKGLPKDVIIMDSAILVEKIVALLLEYGIHGVSHMLLREVSDSLKIRKQRLNEISALIIPQTSKSEPGNLYKAFDSTPTHINSVIDGYHYRIRGGSKLKGFIMITDSKPYTSPQWRKSLVDFDPKSFAVNVIDQLYKRECYRYWEERRNKIAPMIYMADAVIEEKTREILGVPEPVSRMATFVIELFNLNNQDKHQSLSLPLSEFRRLLVSFMVKAVGASTTTVNIEKIKEALHKDARYYLNAVYEYTVPFCFDGCYNCVLIDKGCSLRNPLLKEWVVSRQMTLKILENTV